MAPAEPRTAQAYADALVGRFANRVQDHEAAAARYESALARSPGDDALIDGAISASLAAGDISRARHIARQAPREDVPALVHIVRAIDALNANRAAQADAELAAVEGTAAHELLAQMLLVWARTGEGHVDDITMDLRQLTRVHPYGSMFAYQQGMALDLAGRGEEALVAYGLAAEGGAFFLAPAVERHADLLARTGARDQAAAVLNTPSAKANPALQQALARLEAGDAVAAERLSLSRGAAASMFGLGYVFQQEHDTPNALVSYTLALMLDPSLDIVRITRARLHASDNNLDLARADLDAIAASSPYRTTAGLTQAWLLADAGQEEAALELVRASAASGDMVARRTLGDLYRRMARFDEAEAIYSELIAEAPDQWRYSYLRGVVRERLGRWPEAEADLRRALELSPDQPEVLNMLGYSLIDRGERVEEGVALVRRAVEMMPNSGAVLDSLAWGYYRLGEYERALDLMERALAMEPAHPELNEHLGDIYWRLDRRTEARFQWRRALSLEPDNASELEAKLENGLPDIQSATR